MATPNQDQKDVAPELLAYSGRYRLTSAQASWDADVARLRQDPRTRQFLQFLPETMSVEEACNMRKDRDRDPNTHMFYILSATNDKESGNCSFVGSSALMKVDRDHRCCEAGILISPACHGNGVATDVLHSVLSYAFDNLGMHRVSFLTSIENVPMRAWLDKVAEATLEGTLRDAWSDGKDGYVDVAIYSILQREWQGTKQRLESRLNRFRI